MIIDPDLEKRQGLRRMKLVATSLLVVAFAEAAMIGALADWFAVTALFRHPLRIPIPHTAIIPKRKDQIGQSLGEFVESNFLTREVIDERLRGAELGRRAGEWLAAPTNAARSGDAVADVLRGGLEVLDDDEIQQGLEHLIESRVRATPITPLIGKAVDLTVEGGHQQRLLDAVLVSVAGFLNDNRRTFRDRLDEESPWWVPEPIDDRVFNKIYDAVSRFLDDVWPTIRYSRQRSTDGSPTPSPTPSRITGPRSVTSSRRRSPSGTANRRPKKWSSRSVGICSSSASTAPLSVVWQAS